MEMGLPVVLACNMMDEARKAGIQVDTKELGKQLGIPVVATVARSGEGLKDALREAIAFGRRGSAPLNISYGPDLDPVLTKMERLLAEKGLLTDRYPARWIALKVLENDSEILRQVERMPDVAAQLRAELEIRLEKSEQKARREAERILSDARAVAESTFRELDAMRSAQNEENDHQRINAARAEMRRKLNETQDSLRKDEPAPEEKKSARAVQVGDVVQIRSMGVKATVLAISSDRTLTLQAGILRVTAREDEVLLLENEKPAVTVRTESRGTALRQSAVSSELDIRGMETIEAIPVVERYIDSAVQSRLETVTIIHGKGTGALRAAVQQSLRRNKQVKSFRLGRYGEGETGVTVVELK